MVVSAKQRDMSNKETEIRRGFIFQKRCQDSWPSNVGQEYIKSKGI